MNLLATLIFVGSLAGFSWAACPVASPSKSVEGQGPALEDLRHTGFRYYRDGQYRSATACYAEAVHTAQKLAIAKAATATDLHNLAALAEEMGDYTRGKKLLFARIGSA